MSASENRPNQDSINAGANSTATTYSGSEQPHSKDSLATLINNQMIISGKDALAEEFDVSITTIERWLREGVPLEPSSKENAFTFHRGKVAKWRRQFHGDGHKNP